MTLTTEIGKRRGRGKRLKVAGALLGLALVALAGSGFTPESARQARGFKDCVYRDAQGHEATYMLFAAIVPVAGAADPKLAPRIKHIPCWCFHASNDVGTPVEAERRMIRALRAAGGNPRYEEATGVQRNKHNVWDRAYRKPELYDWLLQQRRP